MKKTMIVSMAVAFASVALAEPAVERVLVRQQWPWSGDVKVEYRITGVTTPVDLQVEFFDGDTPLAAESFGTNFTGMASAILSDGDYAFTFDPVRTFGATVPALTVKLTPVASAYTQEELTTAIYKIVDLESGAVENVTAADLFNNRYGSYVTDYKSTFAPNWSSPKLSVHDLVLWTGVTNGLLYRTSKMAFRRIPAKAYGEWTMGTGTENTANTLAAHKVKLLSDYYISVFEVTQEQYHRFMNSYGPNFPSDDERYGSHLYLPVNGLYAQYANLRGNFSWPGDLHQVGNSSFFGKLRGLTDQRIQFDMPTEAQWEFACRGGTTTVQFDGGSSTDGSSAMKPYAWMQINTRPAGQQDVSYCTPKMVGTLYPNAFGLYDMIGNVSEWCLDWMTKDRSGDDGATDPTGPDGPDSSLGRSDFRALRGGSVGETETVNHRSGRRGWDSDVGATSHDQAGGRLCLTLPLK